MTELARVLFSREDIRRRVEELGRTITGDYVGREPVLISVLKGGTVFLADLMRQIPLPLETHLMAVSPYGRNEESMGRVRILLDIEIDLTDRDVLLVEDIVDTGLTLSYLLSILRSRHPASLEVCTLLGTWASTAPSASSWATASTSKSATATSPTSSRSPTRPRSRRIPMRCCRTSP
jgi:hypoxanthine phosphoribosyltransferase